MEDKKAKFLKAYAQVPNSLKEQIIVIIDEEPYNWSSVFLEIKNNTAISKKILNTLSDMNII